MTSNTNITNRFTRTANVGNLVYVLLVVLTIHGTPQEAMLA